jgi:hypothetical protein
MGVAIQVKEFVTNLTIGSAKKTKKAMDAGKLHATPVIGEPGGGERT